MTDEFKETYKKIGDIVKTLDVIIDKAIPSEIVFGGLGRTVSFPQQLKIKFLHENGESTWEAMGELPTEMKLCSIKELINETRPHSISSS